MLTHKMKWGEKRALSSPITFACHVKGKPLEATLTHLENNYIQYILHVRFSDSYYGEFIHTNPALCQSEEEAAYLRAIQYDLRALGRYSFETKVVVFPFPYGGKVHNLWIFQYESDENRYAVFYRGEYRFSVVETQGDFLLDVEPHIAYTPLDDELSKKAIVLIKAYSH